MPSGLARPSKALPLWGLICGHQPNAPEEIFFTHSGDSGVKAEYFKGYEIEGQPDLIRIEK